MHMLWSVTLVLVGLCLTSVIKADPCCFPNQYELYLQLMSGSVDDEGHTAVTLANFWISTDNVANKVFVNATLDVRSFHLGYMELILSDQNITYHIANGKCTKAPAVPQLKCIPDDAKTISSYTLGHAHGLHVTKYGFTVSGAYHEMEVTDDCFPVTDSYSGADKLGGSFFGAESFANPSLGIKDPSVFNVPAICSQL